MASDFYMAKFFSLNYVILWLVVVLGRLDDEEEHIVNQKQ